MVDDNEDQLPMSEKNDMVEFFKGTADHFKHLTTLSSGFILVMAMFMSKVFDNPSWTWLVALSLFSFIVSVVSSLVAHAYYIDCLQRFSDFLGDRTGKPTVVSTIVAWAAFVLGIVSLSLFSIINLL